MDPMLATLFWNLIAANLGLTLVSLLVLLLHFWAFIWYMRRGFREMTRSQEYIAEMVRDLHSR
jgi:hypothetical protein